MNRPHLSDDELIGLLYGLGDAEKKDGSHLANCSECSERLKAMGQARVATVDVPQISGRRLAAQRLQILERLEHPSSGLLAWRWVPVAAAASLLAAGLFMKQSSSVPHPAPPATAAVNPEADAELFTDVYSMEQDVEPKAVAPIRALFQEASFEEGHQ
jgi:hypothetical protein